VAGHLKSWYDNVLREEDICTTQWVVTDEYGAMVEC
jgi:hypothetical protein